MQIDLSEALNLLKKGELQQAKNICEEILKKETGSSEVYNLHAFILYFDKKFNEAINSWTKAININPNYIEALNGLGNALLKLKKIDQSILNFEKAIKINPNYYEAYCNLGSALLKLGKHKEAITNFEKVIEIKPNYFEAIYGKAYALMKNQNYNEAILVFSEFIKFNPQNADAHNAVGACLISLNKFEDSINYLTKALNFQPKHREAHENLINLLKFYEPKQDYSNLIIKLNKQIRKKNFIFDFENQIKDKDIINYYHNINQILDKEFFFNDFNEEQIFRTNELTLDCDRHFKVFNTYNVIPEYCFSCYKIQINLKNILELFKLHFIFDNIKLQKNNIRKTMIESRPNVGGVYKGLIYCTGLDEAKKILDIIYPIIRFNIDEKINIFIKRGCTEFSISYPNFDKIDQSVKYNENWKEKEKIIDKNNLLTKDTTLKNSISGLTISDALIMKNWLVYAKKIDDMSYKKFRVEISYAKYMETKLASQIAFRKKEFLKIKEL